MEPAPEDIPPFGDAPIELPVDGVLDLHTFRPQQVKELVSDYLDACRERGILRVRIIHGKGIGNLRRTVHAVLSRTPGIESFALATEAFGGWGATIVHLHPPQTFSADQKAGAHQQDSAKPGQ